MGYLKYAREGIVIALVVLLILVIHPFSKQGVVAKDTESPVSIFMQKGDYIHSINGNIITTLDDYEKAISEIEPNDTVRIVLLRETFPYNYREINHVFIAEETNGKMELGIIPKQASFSRITFSHNIAGGNKFTIFSEQSNADEIIRKRLDLNRVYDYSLKKEGQNFILLTTALDEIRPLIESEGKFEARVGEEFFFSTEDVKNICLTGVNCNLRLYNFMKEHETSTEILWKYGFEVILTQEAGERFVELTKGLSIASCQGDACLLNGTIDYYIDDVLIGSEDIYSESKGLPYERVMVGGTELTKDDATKSLYFAQSVIHGELDAEILSVASSGESKTYLFNVILYVAIGLVFASGIASFVFIKKLKVLFAGILLGLAEIAIVVGVLTGLNFIFSILTLAGILVLGATTFAYQTYMSYKFKKEGIIKSKILELSKKINRFFMISLLVLLVLVVVLPSLFAPILIQFTIVFFLTKPLFIKTIEHA